MKLSLHTLHTHITHTHINACEHINTVTARMQSKYPQALIIISGDFNQASLHNTLPTFTQYVDCDTRDYKTLDLLYANVKNAYGCSPLPPLGRSDHNLVYIRSVYVPAVRKQPPTTRTVKVWSDSVYEVLMDCFETTDWEDLCKSHDEDIDYGAKFVPLFIKQNQRFANKHNLLCKKNSTFKQTQTDLQIQNSI